MAELMAKLLAGSVLMGAAVYSLRWGPWRLKDYVVFLCCSLIMFSGIAAVFERG